MRVHGIGFVAIGAAGSVLVAQASDVPFVLGTILWGITGAGLIVLALISVGDFPKPGQGFLSQMMYSALFVSAFDVAAGLFTVFHALYMDHQATMPQLFYGHAILGAALMAAGLVVLPHRPPAIFMPPAEASAEDAPLLDKTLPPPPPAERSLLDVTLRQLDWWAAVGFASTCVLVIYYFFATV